MSSELDEKPKMGAPKKEIDKDLFEVLMGIPFVDSESLAAVFKVSTDTISRFVKAEYSVTFAELKAQKRGNIKLKLAAKQYEVAMKGNISMLIWLGKQYLGQAEKQEVKSEVIEKSVDPKEIRERILADPFANPSDDKKDDSDK